MLKFQLGTQAILLHYFTIRQGCFTTMKPRFSDAREKPSEPDAGHAAVGSRNRSRFPSRPCLTRTAFFITF